MHRFAFALLIGCALSSTARANGYQKTCHVAAGKITSCAGGSFTGDIPVAYNPK
jgi:hypothetical protein